MAEEGHTAGVIVVGVDGSASSQEALRWAAAQASRTGAALEAVCAWSMPATAYGSPLVAPTDLDLEGGTKAALSKAIADAFGGPPPQPIHEVVAEGRAQEVLLDAAQDAELLVVGSRGHGELAGMLLGSVSEYCVAHAKVPVVVVRAPKHA